MKTAFEKFAPRRAVLAFLVFVTVSAVADTSVTNWVPLPELLKKWEPVAIAEIRRQAEAGDVLAQHYLGYAYAEGLRVPANPAEGAAWYQRALTAGYLPSANNLGLLYQRGRLGTNNLARAVYYYRYAADRGLAQSQMNLGVLYRDGEGVPVDFQAARHWFELAADQGHAEAMVELGRLYRFGDGVETNQAEAIRWFEKAADEKNSALARLNLGLLYESDGDQDRAFRYYLQAAEAGDSDAMAQVYLCYWTAKGVAADHAKAMEWLRKSADAENPFGQCLMGYRCENPEWVGSGPAWHQLPADLPGALEWYRKSAAQNWAGGQYHLGMMYLEGEAVAQDEARGLELIRAAADQNLGDALAELADLYARGVGEPRNDRDRPMALLERAGRWEDLQFRYVHALGTERDLVMAARCFSRIFLNESLYYSPSDLTNYLDFKPPRGGLAGPQLIDAPDEHVTILGPVERDQTPSDDVLRVLSAYLKAAKGNNQAALELGNDYLTGKDAPVSTVNAWAWLKLAANNGSSDALSKLNNLEKSMNSSDLEAARHDYLTLTNELNRTASALQ